MSRTSDQTFNLVLDYAATHLAGQTVDAHDIADDIQDAYGVNVNWQEANAVLDRLHDDGQIVHSGSVSNRIARYTIL